MAIDSKNLLVWVKAMSRGQALPLDSSEIWSSLIEAQEYAKSAIAYAGQTIKVVDEATGEITVYIIDTDGSLKTLDEMIELGDYASNEQFNDLAGRVAYINVEDNEDIINPDVSSSDITVDTALSTASENPVQNKVITNVINELEERVADVEVGNSTEMTADGIAEANIMYFLGQLDTLSVGFPDGADIGDMIFISFTSGVTATTLTITTNNYIGIKDFTPESGKYYELIGLWNGETWVFVKNEVSQ